MSFNYNGEGPGFRVPQPMEDRTVELPRVRASVPPPIMAAPADLGITAGHRRPLDEIETLASAARTHLSVWDSRDSDADQDAAVAMGRAIKAIDQLLKTGRELAGDLRLEDTITAVDDDREAYHIRNDETGTT